MAAHVSKSRLAIAEPANYKWCSTRQCRSHFLLTDFRLVVTEQAINVHRKILAKAQKDKFRSAAAIKVPLE